MTHLVIGVNHKNHEIIYCSLACDGIGSARYFVVAAVCGKQFGVGLLQQIVFKILA